VGNYYKHFTILLVLTVVVAFHKIKKTRLECGDTRYCRGNNNNSKLGLKGEKRSASCSQREEEEDDDAKESEVKESDEEDDEEGRAEHTEGGCRKINKCSTGKEHSCMISSKLCVCVCLCVRECCGLPRNAATTQRQRPRPPTSIIREENRDGMLANKGQYCNHNKCAPIRAAKECIKIVS